MTPRSTPWVILDTSIVRQVLHGDGDALDLAALAEARGSASVSLSDVSFAELLHDVMTGAIPLGAWARVAPLLDRVLDDEIPVVPVADDLRAMLGSAAPRPGIVERSKVAWTFLRRARTKGDLREGAQTRVDGKLFRFRPSIVEPHLARVDATWKATIEKVHAASRHREELGVARFSFEHLLGLVQTAYARLYPEVPLDRVDLALRAMAKRTFETERPRAGYVAKRNDALDAEHLFMVGLPGWICTSDVRFTNFARGLGSPLGERVMAPAELMERLRELAATR